MAQFQTYIYIHIIFFLAVIETRNYDSGIVHVVSSWIDGTAKAPKNSTNGQRSCMAGMNLVRTSQLRVRVAEKAEARPANTILKAPVHD